MQRRLSIVLLASLLGTAAVPAWRAEAVTPTQTAIAEHKAKVEAEKRRKLQTQSKRAATLQAKQQSDAQTKARSVTQSRLNVHNESKRRLEATRKAAAVHSRIVDAQLEATHKSDGRKTARRAGKSPRRPLHHATNGSTTKADKPVASASH